MRSSPASVGRIVSLDRGDQPDIGGRLEITAVHRARQAAAETTHEKWGAGLTWSWEILEGRWAGQIIFRTTKPTGTKANSCGKFLLKMTGLSLAEAKHKDLDDYIGVECVITVEETESGSARVESFRVKAAEAKAEADDASNDDIPF